MTKHELDIFEQKINKEARRWGQRRFIWQMVITVAVVYFLFGCLFGITTIKGSSMEPALKEGDIALFLRWGSNYKNGDIVVADTSNEERLIKRIVAVEGDEVNIENESLYVNGKEQSESYIYLPTTERENGLDFPLKLKGDEVFLMGDNRKVSIDSRDKRVGVMNKKDIEGKVIAVFRRE